MNQEYLRPGDVSPADAQRVLDFLNAAQSAQDIAEAIEFPGESDIGVGIARRLLNRRAQLGGAFANLQQVADVPLVGPERFTEIVMGLTGGRLPWAPEAGQPVSNAQLLREIRDLRLMVEALAGASARRDRITLRAVQSNLYLGQPVTIIARVTGGLRDLPRAGVPVTLVATWGTISLLDGYDLVHRRSVTARTSASGTVQFTLLPPTSEDLRDEQQGALETMLRLLQEAAATPRETAEGLQAMVRQYAWESNFSGRRAVDIYFRDFCQRLADTVNLHDSMQAWSYFDATIIAHAHEVTAQRAQESPVQSTAALTLRFKDWLAPWLETYLAMSASESTLTGDLQRDKQRHRQDAGALLSGVYQRVSDFVGRHRGLVGEYVGQRVAEDAMRQFLSSGLEDLPTATRFALHPGLEVATRTVATAGAKVLAGLGQTRADLGREIDSKLDKRIDSIGVEDLNSRVLELETRYNQELAGRLATLEQNYTSLQKDVTAVDTRITTLENDTKVIVTDFNTVGNRVATLEKATSVLRDDLSSVNARVVSLENSSRTLGDNVSSFTDRVMSLEHTSARLTENVRDIERRLSG